MLQQLKNVLPKDIYEIGSSGVFGLAGSKIFQGVSYTHLFIQAALPTAATRRIHQNLLVNFPRGSTVFSKKLRYVAILTLDLTAFTAISTAGGFAFSLTLPESLAISTLGALAYLTAHIFRKILLIPGKELILPNHVNVYVQNLERIALVGDAENNIFKVVALRFNSSADKDAYIKNYKGKYDEKIDFSINREKPIILVLRRHDKNNLTKQDIGNILNILGTKAEGIKSKTLILERVI